MDNHLGNFARIISHLIHLLGSHQSILVCPISRSLVALPPAPDLLFCAKHLFVAAMVANCLLPGGMPVVLIRVRAITPQTRLLITLIELLAAENYVTWRCGSVPRCGLRRATRVSKLTRRPHCLDVTEVALFDPHAAAVGTRAPAEARSDGQPQP